MPLAIFHHESRLKRRLIRLTPNNYGQICRNCRVILSMSPTFIHLDKGKFEQQENLSSYSDILYEIWIIRSRRVDFVCLSFYPLRMSVRPYPLTCSTDSAHGWFKKFCCWVVHLVPTVIAAISLQTIQLPASTVICGLPVALNPPCCPATTTTTQVFTTTSTQ